MSFTRVLLAASLLHAAQNPLHHFVTPAQAGIHSLSLESTEFYNKCISSVIARKEHSDWRSNPQIHLQNKTLSLQYYLLQILFSFDIAKHLIKNKIFKLFEVIFFVKKITSF
jgi:hypothetical protein